MNYRNYTQKKQLLNVSVLTDWQAKASKTGSEDPKHIRNNNVFIAK